MVSPRCVESFTERVLACVRAIPKGSTRTYAQIAHASGSPRAARAVGSIMQKNIRTDVPCHRVVRSDGTIGNYNRGGTVQKKKLLTAEGAL